MEMCDNVEMCKSILTMWKAGLCNVCASWMCLNTCVEEGMLKKNSDILSELY